MKYQVTDKGAPTRRDFRTYYAFNENAASHRFMRNDPYAHSYENDYNERNNASNPTP